MLKIFSLSIFLIIISRIASQTFRLPSNTRPESYIIKLDFIDFESNFSGESIIKIYVEEDSNEITLHSAVNIESVLLCNQINSNCEGEIQIEYNLDNDREFLRINTTSENLKAGENYYLNLKYSGKIHNSVTGVYSGSYQLDGEKKYFLATHMQPTHTRKIFPCFDEPKFKATFQLILIHSNQYNSIANMKPTNEVLLSPNRVIRSFETTPLLPTYLLAFVISSFPFKNETLNGIEFRAFSRENQIENTEFGIKTAINALEKFEETFIVKYEGVGKIDQVALPVFNFGGMENHGIIFYREDFLLYDENKDTLYDKEYVAQTVVHEVCHKFLGNLLTPYWWSVLWLSEGFCKLYEYYMLHPIHPDMRMDELFAVETLQNVMIRDASPSIRPMTFDVETPSQVQGIFDSVAYSKSACVIRMFLHALTPEVFNEGLHIYLRKNTSNPEGIAEPSHLYSALQKALPENHPINVSEHFSTWEHQAGFPYLHVERNYNGNQVRFTQRRFLTSGNDNTSLWHIPISYSTSGDLNILNNFWMTSRQHEIIIEDIRTNHSLFVNIHQHGYYRVLYDISNYAAISRFLYEKDFTLVSPTTRSMLIDDAAVFVENGMLEMRRFFDLIKYLEHDDDWIPWFAATYHLSYMRTVLDDGRSRIYNDFRSFLRKILKKTFNTYTASVKSDEPHHHKHIRNIAINWACQAHLPECLDETEALFKSSLEGYQLPIDHEVAIKCYGVVRADKSTFNYLWGLYEENPIASTLRTIGCIENEEILRDFIGKYQEGVGSHWLTIIQAVYANGPIGMQVTFEFLWNDFNEFSEFININRLQSSLNSIFTGIARRVTSKRQSDEIIELMEQYNISTVTQNTAINSMNQNLQWLEKNTATIQNFLDDYLRGAGNSIKISYLLTVTIIIVKLIL